MVVLQRTLNAENVPRLVTTLQSVALLTSGSSKIHAVEEEEEAYMGMIVGSLTTDPWKVSLLMEDADNVFKLDTGADVTVVPQTAVPAAKRPLQKVRKKLYGPGHVEIAVEGMFKAKLTYKNVSTLQDVYVVKTLEEPLLGRPAITALKLIERINIVIEQGWAINFPKGPDEKLGWF
ncbi:hypothetical protein C0Q70_06826 [Pomacea canaliculata]|uniref:Peptidase A2 domain-containing protein n=1 Tax=Pomacea canaliculata TaxID=400727 RepID=A0A2T7PDB7_POMCA|nr:hypothetical protein C0Q70_06826 [Pomacea canaliculata]